MPRPPLIAITATSRVDEGTRRVRLNCAYTRAVEQAGALPLVIPPLASVAEASSVLEAVDGLVLTGGEDVAPARYGEPAHLKLGPVHEERDATEIALVEAARARATPTLAICRGIQLLNVALGGSLVQDIPCQRPSHIVHDSPRERDARVHDVEVDPGSRLAHALGSTRLPVNSFHHQAIDRVAECLRVTAWAPDGIIEGVEWRGDNWWALGVQWHPEELTASEEPWDRGLFRALVERAKEGRKARVEV
jgi:putative glutamine amidotransferase